ncbi:MAG TPA: Uma2 family endonuclease [Bryobacteraceae bacterium]|jgi:Uma2 family endonuclease|nr:Uma2 family endonuclease [Bryobacteraceae bacterium]
MSTLRKPRLTPEEYLEIEESAEYKSEYYPGEMFAMSGVSPEHDGMGANLIRHLGNQLANRPCFVHTSDMRVHTPATGLYTYPDVTVTCGQPEFLRRPGRTATQLNPTLIIEILSPTTEGYDRGKKFEHYKSIDSLREYLLVSSDRMGATLCRRQTPELWLLMTFNTPEAVIELASIGCRLVLRDLYEKVELPAEPQLRAAEEA